MTQPPLWLADLADRVALAIHGFELLAPIACHVFHNDLTDQWEVTLFPSATEVLGGRFDGMRTASLFSLDLAAAQAAFDSISSFHWQAHRISEDDELGQHVSLEGMCEGHAVWFRILAIPPANFEPGRSLNTVEHRLEELW